MKVPEQGLDFPNPSRFRVIIGISASAVLSKTDRLDELLRRDVTHVEAGFFENIEIADPFVKNARQRGKSVGIHSPLIQVGSKYDLLESVDMPSEDAWHQVEEEAKWCRGRGVQYLLVHFPYAPQSGTLTNEVVRSGLRRLATIQSRYGVSIVCEPKLGDDLNLGAIDWIKTAPPRMFSESNLKLCWDVGDHLLANGNEARYLEEYRRWRKSIQVVHLHNVRREGRLYRWTPPHPNKSLVDSDHDLRPIISELADGMIVVAEYTPQPVASPQNVDATFHYLNEHAKEDKVA